MATNINGEVILPASREVVWHSLNDAETLKACIPGCQSLEKLSDTEFQAVAKLKIGPVSASFKGSVQLSDLDPPNAYRISGAGEGGMAGFAKGGAVVTLTDAEGGTKLSYAVDAQVGGKIMQLGGRLIDGTARKLADQFFENFAKAVSASEASTAGVVPAA